MDSVLADVTVVEVSQGPAAGLATMVMADFGAKVVWFEYAGKTEGYRVWHRGKQRVQVNLVSAQEDAAAKRRHHSNAHPQQRRCVCNRLKCKAFG